MSCKLFISFDYDHDRTLKEFLVGQAKHADSPFVIADWSVKEAQASDWQAHAEMRIKRSDVVAVICGEHTHTATGVSQEVRIAQRLGKPYFLLKGYKERQCTRPKAAENAKMYNWTWDNLKTLVRGGR
jgi:hypothetical protein